MHVYCNFSILSTTNQAKTLLNCPLYYSHFLSYSFPFPTSPLSFTHLLYCSLSSSFLHLIVPPIFFSSSLSYCLLIIFPTSFPFPYLFLRRFPCLPPPLPLPSHHPFLTIIIIFFFLFIPFCLWPNSHSRGFSVWQPFLNKLQACDVAGNRRMTSSCLYCGFLTFTNRTDTPNSISARWLTFPYPEAGVSFLIFCVPFLFLL